MGRRQQRKKQKRASDPQGKSKYQLKQEQQAAAIPAAADCNDTGKHQIANDNPAFLPAANTLEDVFSANAFATRAYYTAGKVRYLKGVVSFPRPAADLDTHDCLLTAERLEGKWRLTRYFRLHGNPDDSAWQAQHIPLTDNPETLHLAKTFATWCYLAERMTREPGYVVATLQPNAQLVTSGLGPKIMRAEKQLASRTPGNP